MTQQPEWARRGAVASGGADRGHPVDAPLDDPYYVPPAPPAPPSISPLAVTSLLTWLLGPVGSVASIVFGWAGRREIVRDRSRWKSLWMANVGIALGVVVTMVWGGLLAWALVQRHRAEPQVARAAELGGPSDPARAPSQPSSPDPAPAQSADPGPTLAPKTTKAAHIGGIEVVDVGAASTSLAEELAKQRAAAAKSGVTPLVMTTARRCDPCRGVDESLRDPLLQTALARVRLVRVDVEVFREDLDQLKMPTKAIPHFFLLAPDLTPRDGIHGGEWDDDIPPNIAPVLGAFVRGKYGARRYPWQPLPGSGMRL